MKKNQKIINRRVFDDKKNEFIKHSLNPDKEDASQLKILNYEKKIRETNEKDFSDNISDIDLNISDAEMEDNVDDVK